jgi:hypothetical protein
LKALAYTMIAAGLIGIVIAFLIGIAGDWGAAAGHGVVSSLLIGYGNSWLQRLRRAREYARLAATSTVRLPAPAGTSALIATQIARRRRSVLIIILGGPVVMSIVAISVWGSVRDTGLLIVLLAIGVAYAIIVGAFWVFTGERPAWRDKREAVFCRSQGPVELAYASGWVVRIGDAAFIKYGPYTPEDEMAVKALKRVGEGTVDYTPHSRLIFEVRDVHGQTLYRMDGYDAPGGR